MAERSSLNQVIQLGMESTPGTPVAATKRLQSIGLSPSPKVEMDKFRPAGQKFQALTTLGKEWTEAPIAGRGSYTEIVYALSSVCGAAAITTPVGATNARQWAFSPNNVTDDVPKTFTVEHGSSVRADRFSYGLITELGMKFDRQSIEVSGSMIGRALEDAFTLTSSGVTSPDLVPIIPTQVTVYIDSTSAGLGTTKLTRALSADFNLGSRFAPVWVLDAANPSFVNHVETEPDLTCNITMEADAQGMGFLAGLRTGDTSFIRIEAVGAEVETGFDYKFTLDMAANVADTGGFSDADGVYAVEFNFVGVNSPTWGSGKAVQFAVVNDMTAL